MHIEIRKIYERLGGGDSSGGSIGGHETDIRAGSGNLGLARDAANRLVALFPVAEASAMPSRTAGITLTLNELRFNESESHQLHLVVTNEYAPLEPVFLDLVGSLARQFEGAPDDVARAIAEFNSWKALFGNAPTAERMEVSALVGGIGELVVLNDLVHVLGDGSAAIEAWFGHEKDSHDFRWNNSSLEVKATTSAAFGSIVIHGLDQLEPPSNGTLHMELVRLRKNQGATSLKTLHDSISATLTDPLDFRKKLQAAGLDEATAGPDWETSFDVVQRRLHHVDEEFPALRISDFVHEAIPNDVSQIQYRINLADISPIATDQTIRSWVDSIK